MGGRKETFRREGARALGAAALVVAISVAPALATRGTTRTQTKPFPQSEQASAQATCGKGSHSTSGGYRVNPPSPPGTVPGALVQGNTRTGNRGWRVAAGSTSAHLDGTLTAYVRCERRSDGRIAGHLIGRSTIEPGTATPFVFTCPPGTRPIGGGWSVDNLFNGTTGSSLLVVVENRRKSARVWRITAYVPSIGNPASNPASELTATVPCERKNRRKIVQRSRLVPINETARSGATATCRKGTHVISGGFVITPLPPGAVPYTPIDRHHPASPRTWRVELYDTGLGSVPAGSALTTYAYCKQNRTPRRRGRAASASAAPYFGTAPAEVGPAVPVATLP